MKRLNVRMLAVVVTAAAWWTTGIARADTLYVSDAFNWTINTFSTSGGGGSVFVNQRTPRGLAFDVLGNLYVADITENKIVKFAPNGTPQPDFATSGLSSPEGMAFDALGNLYVVNEFNDTIEKFAPDGTPSLFATLADGAFGGNEWGLAFDHLGNLYVGDGWNETIVKITPLGTQSVFASVPGQSVTDIAFDSLGNLFAVESPFDIEKFSPTGTDLGLFATAQFSNIQGIAFDSAGNLYASEAGGGIEKFAPNGSESVFTHSPSNGLHEPNFMVIVPQAVPEPGTIGLSGVGLSLLALRFGLLRRWRPRRKAAWTNKAHK